MFCFLEQKSNDDQLDTLWKHFLKVNARHSEVDGQIQSKIESMVSNGESMGPILVCSSISFLSGTIS